MNFLIDPNAVVQGAYHLPPLPQTALRLMGLLSNENSNIRELVEVIECDPVLSMQLLRVANSVIGAARHRIGTVREALIRLGTGTVTGFVIDASVRPIVGERITGYNLTGSEYRTHSLASAFAAESIQAHSANWSGQLGFTAALLHDVGKLVLGQFLNPELVAWLELARTQGHQTAFEAENEILSLNHCDAGAIIAQNWGLPDALVKGILYHHNPEQGAEGICDVTYLANLAAHWLEMEAQTESGEPPYCEAEVIGPALTRLGLAEKHWANVLADTRERLQSVAELVD